MAYLVRFWRFRDVHNLKVMTPTIQKQQIIINQLLILLKGGCYNGKGNDESEN